MSEAKELRATCNALRDRAEAAEARCERLADAASRLIDSIIPDPDSRDTYMLNSGFDCWESLIGDIRAALSDTAQQETRLPDEDELIWPIPETKVIPNPAIDMRERAAKLVEDMTLKLGNAPSFKTQIADRIRALPLEDKP